MNLLTNIQTDNYEQVKKEAKNTGDNNCKI